MTPAEQRAASRRALAAEDERVRLLIEGDPIAQEAVRLNRASGAYDRAVFRYDCEIADARARGFRDTAERIEVERADFMARGA